MPKKKLHNHPVSGFIPGIYNFCDRWCEKCSYKANCLSYTMEKKFKEREGEDSERNVMHLRDSFWNYWEYICRSAYDVVQDIAKERGVGIEDIYLAEPLREEGLWHKFGTEISDDEDEYSYIETFDIVNICQLYEVLAEECLDEIFGFLDEQDWKRGSENYGGSVGGYQLVFGYDPAEDTGSFVRLPSERQCRGRSNARERI